MKEMAEMLRRGAKMLSITCPECSSPLFQMKSGEIYCPHCKREVKIVEEGRDVNRVTLAASLERTLISKLNLIQKQLESEEDPLKIKELSDTVVSILNAIKQINAEESPKIK